MRLVALLIASLVLAAAARAQPCARVDAEVIAVEGTVELQRSQSADWVSAATGDALCGGDIIRVALYSRAALRLTDDTVLRLDQNTTLSLPEAASEHPSWIEVLRGLIHVISRNPRALKFTTPYANAGLEGTEFVVAVDEEARQTAVTVLEGVVLVENAAGAVDVAAGERGTARAEQRPEREAVANANAAVQWALYYWPLHPADRRPTPAGANPPAARAAARLAVGRVAEARADIADMLAANPADADALALESVLALTQNNKQQARALAQRAVAAQPDSTPALIALSYAQQAQFELPAALASLEHAVEQAPANALAWARLAELRLSLGQTRAGRDAARRAVELDAELGYAQTMLGFAELNALALDAAMAAFEHATALDAAAPWPRLGLGLALARRGELERGRRELELAVLLDPSNALARSYVAKAYYDERRNTLPGKQWAMAKALDPTDPTAWLYDAIRKQAINRPAEALADLQRAIALNGEETPFRSQLRLDEDLATRSASLGRIYRDLGFEQLALSDGWAKVAADPADYSGHRLLADSYSSLPRHQIARVNELYQAQLLQPFNMTPVPPQLAETNLFIRDSAGPDDAAYNEFNPLLARRHFAVQGAGVTAGNDTRGEEVVAAGVGERTAYSVGQFHFTTDGFRANNDFTTDVRNAFLQFRPNERLSLQAELRTSDTEKGDQRLLFDPDNFSSLLRQDESVDSIRLGLSSWLSDRDVLLASVIHQRGSAGGRTGPAFSLDLNFDGTQYQFAHIHVGSRWQLDSGLSYLTEDSTEQTHLQFEVPFPPFVVDTLETTDHAVAQFSAYSYAQVAISQTLSATFGASLDRLDGQFFDRRHFNPKLGLLWRPTARTTVRAGAFRILQGQLLSKQNVQPRLEPTQIAGFNQFFFGSEGEEARRYGIGVDHEFASHWYAGAELSNRDLLIPIALITPPSTTASVIIVNAEEDFARGYLYWTPTDELALGAEYQYEGVDNNGQVSAEDYTELRTHRLPLQLKYFSPSGWSSALTATYVDQRGEFANSQLATPAAAGADHFWVLDAGLGFRLPQRRGRLNLTVHNLLDERFQFQDTDPENPSIMPERMVSLRFTLAY